MVLCSNTGLYRTLECMIMSRWKIVHFDCLQITFAFDTPYRTAMMKQSLNPLGTDIFIGYLRLSLAIALC